MNKGHLIHSGTNISEKISFKLRVGFWSLLKEKNTFTKRNLSFPAGIWQEKSHELSWNYIWHQYLERLIYKILSKERPHKFKYELMVKILHILNQTASNLKLWLHLKADTWLLGKSKCTLSSGNIWEMSHIPFCSKRLWFVIIWGWKLDTITQLFNSKGRTLYCLCLQNFKSLDTAEDLGIASF